MDYLIFIGVSMLWGGSFILMKYALLCFDPIYVGAFRVLCATLILGILWKIFRPKDRIAKSDLLSLILIALTGIAIPFSLQPYLIRALQNSGFIGMMVVFVPIFTVIASIPLLKKWPTKRELFGVLGGLLCLYPIYWDGISRDITLTNLLLASITPLLYAIHNTWVKRRLSHCSPIGISTLTFFFSCIPLFSVGLFTDEIRMNQNFPLAAISLMILGIFSTGIAGYLFFILIQRRGPLFAGMVGYIIPSLAVILGWLAGEELSALQIFALAMVYVMVAIVQSQRPAPKS